ncbi:MAG: hypothetical protein HOA19_00195, partial [Candidatus Marinimicrobia bacterium]|nr:hypothetical protein [Candidatus Neomarinimicrobiota bacterium]MBT6796244.1 hypothetical protein [Candidatus Neomarinimicrobiota bacterium]MBT6865745.1 hypothetical protein [Candidatus Neomarinimicrobiota bacterium]MBT7041963.1 hypothetical protein [Candidatus Neomarinimicrobiota bacterium]MBT7515446.1 hypothetical protein [Candidatus Neomarinimicrobiota bacterium]
FLTSTLSMIMAQGVGFPSDPAQAPIGGLELLIGAGGAMAYKKLKNRNK